MKKKQIMGSILCLLYVLQGISSGSGLAKVYYEQANNSYAKSELEQSIILFDKAISEDPSFSNAYYGKAKALYNKGEYKKARDCCKNVTESQSLAKNADMPKFWNLIGLCEEKIIELSGILPVGAPTDTVKDYGYDAAISSYDYALKINPRDTSVLNNKGVALGKQEDYLNSKECFNNAILINPELIEALNNMGVSLEMEGNYEDALKYYGRALSIDPEMPEALYNKGSCEYELGNFDESRKCYLLSGLKGEYPDPRYMNIEPE